MAVRMREILARPWVGLCAMARNVKLAMKKKCASIVFFNPFPLSPVSSLTVRPSNISQPLVILSVVYFPFSARIRNPLPQWALTWPQAMVAVMLSYAWQPEVRHLYCLVSLLGTETISSKLWAKAMPQNAKLTLPLCLISLIRQRRSQT